MASLPSFLAAAMTASQDSFVSCACAGTTRPTRQAMTTACSVLILTSPSQAHFLFGRSASELDHHILLFDRDREGLGPQRSLDQRPARLDLRFVAAHLGPVGLAPGFPGSEIELPAMPWAANELAAPADLVA